MQGVQRLANLDEVAPDGVLLDVLVCLLELVSLPRDVAVLCKLHHNVQVVLLHKRIAVPANQLSQCPAL